MSQFTHRTKPWWCVWEVGGPPPVLAYLSCQHARGDAKRLARENPGKQYVVFKADSIFAVRDEVASLCDGGAVGPPEYSIPLPTVRAHDQDGDTKPSTCSACGDADPDQATCIRCGRAFKWLPDEWSDNFYVSVECAKCHRRYRFVEQCKRCQEENKVRFPERCCVCGRRFTEIDWPVDPRFPTCLICSSSATRDHASDDTEDALTKKTKTCSACGVSFETFSDHWDICPKCCDAMRGRIWRHVSPVLNNKDDNGDSKDTWTCPRCGREYDNMCPFCLLERRDHDSKDT